MFPAHGRRQCAGADNLCTAYLLLKAAMKAVAHLVPPVPV